MKMLQEQNNRFDIYTVISGSFRKHLEKIYKLKDAIQHLRIGVLSPSGSHAINKGEEFIILDSDPVSHPKLLQDSIFAKIRQSSFLLVANFDGYIGKAAILEMGYAIAAGVSIYTMEPIEDPNLKPYCQLITNIFPLLDINKIYSDELAETTAEI